MSTTTASDEPQTKCDRIEPKGTEVTGAIGMAIHDALIRFSPEERLGVLSNTIGLLIEHGGQDEHQLIMMQEAMWPSNPDDR